MKGEYDYGGCFCILDGIPRRFRFDHGLRGIPRHTPESVGVGGFLGVGIDVGRRILGLRGGIEVE